jgi:hypothetical protein
MGAEPCARSRRAGRCRYGALSPATQWPQHRPHARHRPNAQRRRAPSAVALPAPSHRPAPSRSPSPSHARHRQHAQRRRAPSAVALPARPARASNHRYNARSRKAQSHRPAPSYAPACPARASNHRYNASSRKARARSTPPTPWRGQITIRDREEARDKLGEAERPSGFRSAVSPSAQCAGRRKPRPLNQTNQEQKTIAPAGRGWGVLTYPTRTTGVLTYLARTRGVLTYPNESVTRDN